MSKNKKKVIAVVVLSRANYARIKYVLKEIQKSKKLELKLIVGGSALLRRYGDITDIVKKDKLKIAASFDSVVEGDKHSNMVRSLGMCVLELASILEKMKPDIVFTVADRHETLATAIVGSYMNIIVAHTQGGEVSGSIDESVRHSITKLSHIHFTATKKSMQRVIKMGEDKKFVFNTGCPAMDILTNTNLNLKYSMLKKYKIDKDKIDIDKDFIMVLQHPVTTEYETAEFQIQQTLKAVVKLKMQTIWIWPNIDAGSDTMSKVLRTFREENPNTITFVINFSPEDYAILLANTKCIIGNSSSGIRESAFLGTPAVNVGTRQNYRERGNNVVDVDYNYEKIYQAVLKSMKKNPKPSNIFGDGKAAKKIVRHLNNISVNAQKKLSY